MNDQKRYVVYCRKSTDRDDKQIQSLETQEEHILTYAIKNNLTITTIYKEAHSAKRPNRRPIWDQVLKDLRTRKANCLLVYTISRCSRNPQESGILQQLLVDRVIQEIRTIIYA
jgi:DNA invertase Pin-like site-specific DNA recombinase